MTMEALNGTKCNNDTIIIHEPSTVAFRCMYEIDQSTTTQYTWSMDGNVLIGMTSNDAHVPISAGTHYVTCTADIDISDIIGNIRGAENCVCYNETRTFYVTVVGT